MSSNLVHKGPSSSSSPSFSLYLNMKPSLIFGEQLHFQSIQKVDSNARTYSRTTYNRDKKIRTSTMYVKLDEELELLSYNDEHQSRAEVRTNCLSPLTFIILKVVHRSSLSREAFFNRSINNCSLLLTSFSRLISQSDK